jgi:hypothetical protein
MPLQLQQSRAAPRARRHRLASKLGPRRPSGQTATAHRWEECSP